MAFPAPKRHQRKLLDFLIPNLLTEGLQVRVLPGERNSPSSSISYKPPSFLPVPHRTERHKNGEFRVLSGSRKGDGG